MIVNRIKLKFQAALVSEFIVQPRTLTADLQLIYGRNLQPLY